MVCTVIPISKKPNFIIITIFSFNNQIQYWVDEIKNINIDKTDIGIWKIKYKQ